MYLNKRFVLTIIIFFSLCTASLANENLNILFEKLNAAKDVNTAEQVEKSIWNAWITHPHNEYLTNKLENATIFPARIEMIFL